MCTGLMGKGKSDFLIGIPICVIFEYLGLMILNTSSNRKTTAVILTAGLQSIACYAYMGVSHEHAGTGIRADLPSFFIEEEAGEAAVIQ